MMMMVVMMVIIALITVVVIAPLNLVPLLVQHSTEHFKCYYLDESRQSLWDTTIISISILRKRIQRHRKILSQDSCSQDIHSSRCCWKG